MNANTAWHAPIQSHFDTSICRQNRIRAERQTRKMSWRRFAPTHFHRLQWWMNKWKRLIQCKLRPERFLLFPDFVLSNQFHFKRSKMHKKYWFSYSNLFESSYVVYGITLLRIRVRCTCSQLHCANDATIRQFQCIVHTSTLHIQKIKTIRKTHNN